jgi:IS30 family transposase
MRGPASFRSCGQAHGPAAGNADQHGADLTVALPSGNHRADVVADALAAAVATLPTQLARPLTWDQGHERAQHQRFTTATGIQV